MKLETFFEKFDQFADAPDAVEKMRELVLDLAVQGKLSEQRAEDAKDPEWLKLTRQLDADSAASTSDLEPPFEIPTSWRWTTLKNLGDTKPRNEAPDSAKSSFVPMTLIPAEYGQRAQHEERPWGEIKKGYTHFKTGDVVIAKITPCFENGKSAVMNGLTGGFGAGTTELHVFRRSGAGVLPEFVIIHLKTRGFITRGIPRMTGSAGQKRVPSDYFARSRFPLPPPAEQKRIVAKVNELMALCDRLDAQQQERDTRHAALARASLARFAEAPTPANLQFLFHPSYPISPADLRKSILTLAVQGKLVPQDPNDEPVRKQKLRVRPDDDVHVIPTEWVWTFWEDVLAPGKAAFKRGPFGSSLRKSDFVASGFKVYEQYCPINDDCSFARYYISQEKFETMKSFAVQAGDFLISCSGVTLGRITQVPDVFEAGIINQALLRVRIEGSVLDSLYFKMLFRSPFFQDRIFANSTGSAIPNVKGVRDLKAMPIPVPPLAEQCRIVAKVNQLMALVDELETQLATSHTNGEKLLAALTAKLSA
jgi:type I restriction enzyme S subunit